MKQRLCARIRAAALVAAGAVSLAASDRLDAAFVGFVVTSTPRVCCGNNLVVYQLFAEFNGPTDTVLNVFNLTGTGGTPLTGFWHKDLTSSNSGVCMREFGSWSLARTGSATQNRPCDSYVSIGCCNPADPLPSGANPPIPGSWLSGSTQIPCGRVGTGCNPLNRVFLAQLVLSAGESPRTYIASVAYSDGVGGSPVQFGTGAFGLCNTGPTWYRDLDGDGIGAAVHGTITACQQPQGFVATGGDNCPCESNPTQADSDGDGIGDACESLGGADCNSNGLSDACDISSGLSTDLNSNTVPDECEFVVGGTGFATIQAAVNAAGNGQTIFVSAGTYTGAIDIAMKTGLTLRSAPGANTVTLSGTGISQSIVRIRASSAVVIDGFRIRDGRTGSICFGQYLCGGGLLVEDSAGVEIRNCVFESNSSGSGGAVAVYNTTGLASNCSFFGNSASMDGGAIEVGAFGDFVVTNCLISGNSAPRGGGANAWDTTLRFQGCEFSSNLASLQGGGVSWYSRFGTPVAVQGCLFLSNSAPAGGAITRIEGEQLFQLGGSRFCANTPSTVDAPFNDLGGNILVGDCNGNGVCDWDEIAAGARDCNANGRLDSCEIAAGSPDIDADGRIDACETARGDLNLDGSVGPPDLAILLAAWGVANPSAADLNGDGVVSAPDLGVLLVRWGAVNF